MVVAAFNQEKALVGAFGWNFLKHYLALLLGGGGGVLGVRGRGGGEAGGRAVPGVGDGVALELGELAAQPRDPVNVVHVLTTTLYTLEVTI